RDFDEVGGFYANLGIGHSFAMGEQISLDLSASVGYADSDYNKFYFGVDDSGLVDFNIGASLPIAVWKNITITPVLNYTALVDDDLRDAVDEGSCCDNKDNIYGGISFAVSF
ncbi:MAG: MipA/OmpV family protein, partial [Deltaproteobacteria bacterium]|nr:MipA/OmpV family protein [Deltaproteobacteria bacterium]